VGFLVLATVANLLSAVLAAGALLFYVFVYTAWLKRRSVQNIVIGGAAGAVPPLVGWAAVRGSLGWEAVALFTVILLWTPPHFWALALRYQGDYAAAGVPMLPVVRGASTTRRQIAAYSLLLVPVSLVPSLAGGAGPVYLIAALALGAALVWEALALLRRGDAYPVMRLFHFSITYLTALFAALLLDQALRPWLAW
jgi:protoheme IX farnesyltransferase